MKSFFFGPVFSRRFGNSLGIDILPEKKTCTFDCLYCEVGRARRIVPIQRVSLFKNEIERFKKELQAILRSHISITSLTFAGYMGEPTLNKNLKDFASAAREVRDAENQDIPLTILTNSSTIKLKEVQEVLKEFDQIVAKLDAYKQNLFEMINRPHLSVPPIEEIIYTLVRFNKSLQDSKKLFIQTLFIPENACHKNVDNLARAYSEIEPWKIQIYTIARSPAFPFVKHLPFQKLEQIARKIKTQLPSHIQLQAY